MKLKVLLVLILTVFIVFVIYLSNIDSKIYYLSLGDYLLFPKNSYANKIKEELKDSGKLEIYVDEFNQDHARITDLLNSLEENKSVIVKNKEKTIKNALIKSDFTLVSIGSNDLFYELENKPLMTESLYDTVDEILADSKELYHTLRMYCKEDIFATSFYNPISSDYDDLFAYANTKLQKILKEEDINYIDIEDCLEENRTSGKLLTDIENTCISSKIKRNMRVSLFEE